MYLRTVKVRGSTGITHEYLRLIESYWEDGQAKQRIVSNLGRKDLLAPHLEGLGPPARRRASGDGSEAPRRRRAGRPSGVLGAHVGGARAVARARARDDLRCLRRPPAARGHAATGRSGLGAGDPAAV